MLGAVETIWRYGLLSCRKPQSCIRRYGFGAGLFCHAGNRESMIKMCYASASILFFNCRMEMITVCGSFLCILFFSRIILLLVPFLSYAKMRDFDNNRQRLSPVRYLTHKIRAAGITPACTKYGSKQTISV